MFFRSLLAAAAVFAFVGFAQAARITHFTVKCVDRQEVSADDVFLAGVRDDQPVPWGKDHQAGTSSANSLNMNDGDVFTLDAKSLAELKFDKELKVVVKEKDVASDDTIGTVTIHPTDGMQKQIFKTDDFEYHVEFTVAK